MNILIIGKNSKLVQELGLTSIFTVPHNELPLSMEFDRVYIFSYSMKTAQNEQLLQNISKLRAREIVYISSITTLIPRKYNYRYVRAKREAEVIALELGFKVVRIGLVVETLSSKLSNGRYVVTALSDLRKMIVSGDVNLPDPVTLLVGQSTSMHFQTAYLKILRFLGKHSILLRPFDAMLKMLGATWYGYNSLISYYYVNRHD